jgi:hypothetical protein
VSAREVTILVTLAAVGAVYVTTRVLVSSAPEPASGRAATRARTLFAHGVAPSLLGALAGIGVVLPAFRCSSRRTTANAPACSSSCSLRSA